MKTNPLAQRSIRIRLLLTCLAIVLLAGVEFGAAEFLLAQVGQNTSIRTQDPQIPEVTSANWTAATL